MVFVGGSGCGVRGSEFGVEGLGFRVSGQWLTAHTPIGACWGVGVQSLEFRLEE